MTTTADLVFTPGRPCCEQGECDGHRPPVRTYVPAGETVSIRLPWSEVCCYLGVAGCVREVLVKEHSAQILVDGRPYSFPITLGEAGFHLDQQGQPYYLS